MGDRIYTYQQKLEIIQIERLQELITSPHKDYKSMKIAFRSLCRLVDGDPNQPKHVKPRIYFRDSVWFKDRVHLDDILDWLATIHTVIDRSSSPGIRRQ